MLTIWERLLGHPLISSIFSFAAASGKKDRNTDKLIYKRKQVGRFPKPEVQDVLSESVPHRFLTPNVETRSCLSNCVAGPAGMRLLWGFPEGDWLLSTLHPSGPSHTPHPTAAETGPFAHSWQMHTRLQWQLHACRNRFTSCAVGKMCGECVRRQVSKHGRQTHLRRSVSTQWLQQNQMGVHLWNNLLFNHYFIMLFN